MCPIGIGRDRRDIRLRKECFKKIEKKNPRRNGNKLFKQQKIIKKPLDYGAVVFQSKSELI